MKKKRRAVSRSVLKRLWAINPQCGICGQTIEVLDNSISGDHIIPVSKGGSNYSYNIQLAHNRCNFKKADKLPRLASKTPEGRKQALNHIDNYLKGVKV